MMLPIKVIHLNIKFNNSFFTYNIFIIFNILPLKNLIIPK